MTFSSAKTWIGLLRNGIQASAAGLLFLIPVLADGQAMQFGFDANGNLVVRSSETNSIPQILSQPQPQVVPPAGLASFFVVAANSHNLAYQWRFNGSNIGGATNDALLLQNVGAANEGQYSVVLTNIFGSVTSAPAALMLDGDRDGLADSWELANFGHLNQYPTGDPDGDGVSNLDEFLDGTNPADSASARFRLTVMSDSGLVTVSPMRLSYTNGEMVTLTATAFAPNTFHAWTGDINTTSNPITLTMTSNKTVFAHLSSYELVWAAAGGDWNVASNWTPSLVPGANDNVFITRGVSVTLNTTVEIRSLTLGSSIVSPTLTGTGTLTLHKDSLWASGTMSGGGRTIVAEGATLTMANANTLFLTSRTLENGGTIVWTSANISLGSAVITNRAGSLFDAQNPGDIYGPGSRLDNAGTFRKSISSGTTTVGFGVSLNNYGTVEIQTGTLALPGGGANSGAYDVGGGTTLNMSGAHTASAGSSITGAGNLTVSGGTVTLAGLVNVRGTNLFDSGTANLNGNYICTNNTLVISGGTVTFNGTGTVTPAAVDMDSGTLSGQMVTVLSQMNWSGGTMSGSGRTLIPPGATLDINGATTKTLSGGRILENGGTTYWNAGNVQAATATVITNRAGALFLVQSAAGITAGAGGGRFDNAGTFRKTSAGTTTINNLVSFNNYGTVELQSGALSLVGGGLNDGTMDMAAGATLNLSGGTFTSSGGSSITGAGNFTVSGATATLSGLVNVSGTNRFDAGTASLTGNYICTNNTLTIAGGTANFNGTGTITPAVVNMDSGTLSGQMVTVLSQMNWSGGTMSGSGRTLIAPGATLDINGATTKTLSGGRILENGGTTYWNAGNVQAATATVITNRAGALFLVQSAAGITPGAGGGRFDNTGTFRKTSTGTTTINNLVSFNNYNTVDLLTGTLVANGGYISTANSLLHCALGGTTPGTGYGRLQVAGTVALNGALSVTLTNGFVPTVNDTFTVLTAGTRNGTFANFYYPSNEVTMVLSNTANSVIVRVSEVLVVPPPILLQPELSGTDLRLIWTAISNTTYRLEYETDLGLTNWTGLAGDVTTLSNTASKLDALTSSNRFYRVRVIP